ncbi:hypothetical protein [Pandoraea oxalativorans]|uniref:Uncharacterized protein n=1 Tax=Pandoraea oxalativorans TaxID=573737 RepID=A0A0E3YAN1_9BURK|nr:hypothetical protein [Pandoraea oxalativorans]AKC69025.1 hypothetical protein MB84_05420 [Pandoraea oxalativorans]
MKHAISMRLLSALPQTFGTFLHARSAADVDPLWLLEYAHGHLTFMVSFAGRGFPEVRFGGRTAQCESWLYGPSLFESRRMLLMYGSAVRGTRADIVACIDMILSEVVMR